MLRIIAAGVGLAVLVSCASPSPEFLAAERSTYVLGHFSADVYQNGSSVQAIRTSTERDWRSDRVENLMRQAIMIETSCDDFEVLSFDEGTVMTARLLCP